MTTFNTISNRIFGNRIKNLRIVTGLTQVEILRRQKKRRGIPPMNQSVLSRLEAGKVSPSAHTLLVLCEIYHVSADYLLTGKESNHDNPMRVQ